MFYYSAKHINLDFVYNKDPVGGIYTFYRKSYSNYLIYCISSVYTPKIYHFSTRDHYSSFNISIAEYPLIEIDVEKYIKYSYLFIKRYNKNITFYSDGILINPGKLIYGILP